MKPSRILLCCLIFSTATVVFAQEKAVVLKADYPGKQNLTYTIEYVSQGNFRQKLSNKSKSTTIHATVKAVPSSDHSALGITTDSCTITSTMYKEDLQKEIRDHIAKTNYAFSLTNGFPSPDTSMNLPGSVYLEWDLYRQLAKLLPVLPTAPVTPGYSWDRTMTVPLKTARGNLSCEVYRSYTFDKLNGDTATLSWKFRYAGNSKNTESANALHEIPVFGTGNGSAIIDIKNGVIIKASMNFTTPVAVVGEVNVVWHETANIGLIGK